MTTKEFLKDVKAELIEEGVPELLLHYIDQTIEVKIEEALCNVDYRQILNDHGEEK